MGTVYGQLCLGTLVLRDAVCLEHAVLSGLATALERVRASNVDCGGATSLAVASR